MGNVTALKRPKRRDQGRNAEQRKGKKGARRRMENQRQGAAGLAMKNLQLNWAYVSTYYPQVAGLTGWFICHLEVANSPSILFVMN